MTSKNRTKFWALLTAIFPLAVVFSSMNKAAADVIITNSGFEDPLHADGGFANPTGWSVSAGAGTGIGSLNPIGVQFAGTDDAPGSPGLIPGTGDGFQVGYISGAFQMWQNIGTIVANADYELTVAIGERLDLGWSDLTVALRANSQTGTLLADDVYTAADAPDGTFSDVSFSFNSAGFAGEVGSDLFVVFTGTGTQALFDNLRVSETTAAVPEPSTFAVLGIGAIGFLGHRRRKRKQAA